MPVVRRFRGSRLSLAVADVSDYRTSSPRGKWSRFYSAVADRFDLAGVVRPTLWRQQRIEVWSHQLRRGPTRWLPRVASARRCSPTAAWPCSGRSTLRPPTSSCSSRRSSIDMSGGYQQAIRQSIPHAEICFDPFHVVRLAQRAVDQVRRDELNAHDRSRNPAGRWVKGTRWSLLKSPEKQTIDQLAKLGEVQQANRPLYRAFLLKKSSGFSITSRTPSLAPEHLDAWLTWATRSRLEPFVKLARPIRRHRDAILNGIRLGLNNGRLEGLNSRIRLISHRSFGFHSASPLIALVYLCCARVVTPLPR